MVENIPVFFAAWIVFSFIIGTLVSEKVPSPYNKIAVLGIAGIFVMLFISPPSTFEGIGAAIFWKIVFNSVRKSNKKLKSAVRDLMNGEK